MAVCTDPKLTYLNDLGYNVLRLPRQGLVPLGLIGVDGQSKNWLGTLDQYWKSAVSVPVAGPQQAAGAISGFRTSNLNLSAGLDILANILNGMFGDKAPSLDAHYQTAKSIQFELGDVTVSGIEPGVINSYMAKGDLVDGPWVRRYFSGVKGTRVLLVTQVLLAKSIKVTAKKDATTAVNVDVPAIQAALSVKAGVTVGSTDGTTVTYNNAVPLVFGFQVFEIAYSAGEWEVRGVKPSAAVSFADYTEAATEPQPDLPIVEEAQLVEIEFPQ